MSTTPKAVQRRDGTTVWRVRFRVEKNANPRSKTFEGEGGAEGAARFAAMIDAVGGKAALAALEATSGADITRTMRTAFEEMLTDREATVTGGTIRATRDRARRWLAVLGAYPVVGVTEKTILGWLSQRRRDPGRFGGTVAKNTLNNELMTLRSTLRREVRLGTIRVNPAEDVKVPRDAPATHDPVFLTQAQQVELWEAFSDPWRLLVQLTVATGMRWGEVTALRPRDLALDGNPPAVRVTRAWKRQEDLSFRIGPPKNGRARTVSLPRSIVQPLRDHIAHRRIGAEDLMWTNRDGGQLVMGTWWHVWDHAVTASKIGVRPHFHDLRHTHASMLIAAGVPMKVISERLGHSSITITIDLYGHLEPDAAIKAAATVDRIMFGAPTVPVLVPEERQLDA